MRKLSEKQKERLTKHTNARIRKLRRRAERYDGTSSKPKTNKTTRFEYNYWVKKYPGIHFVQVGARTSIVAPKVMRLTQNNDEVMLFLKCLRELTNINLRQLVIDFTQIETMSPLCAMMLATEIHRWKLVKIKRMIVVDQDKWKPEIRGLLAEIGIFDVVPVINPYHHELDASQGADKYISLRSGQLVNLESAVKEIEGQVAKVSILLNSDPYLYGGIEEAITNVLQWAYKVGNKQKTHPKLVNRWWFLASYNAETRRITIMVYDHGVGIPKTLPANKKWSEQARKWLDSNNILGWPDHKVIEAAMKFPRSASGKSYRARGLRKMKELLQRFSAGTLFIYSGYGEYRVNHKNEESIVRHKYPIGGTLIVWEVYMDEGAND